MFEETIVAEFKVQSEITGKVWAIEANIGDKLDEEDTIIVLESMKMEIPVTAPQNGTLKEILVAEGDAVTEGQDVAIMEG
jgi:acetyl-CoA carboxylase biotin carboxyl carrier protein